MEILALRSSVSIIVIKETVVFHFGVNKVVHLGLTFDGFEDVLDRELQRDEAARYLISLGLALMRVRERLLLESALSTSLEVIEGASVWWPQFCFAITDR